MIQTTTRVLLMSLCVMSAASGVVAQEPTLPPQDQPAAAAAQRPGFTPPTQEPQPYDKVITKEAKSKKGIFSVHQVKDKYYYEIPKSEFNKEFLWVAQIARTTLGAGYGGQALGNRVVRWERNGAKVHLRNINYSVVADPRKPISQAVQAANNDTILMTFPVAAWGPDDSAVIEVSRLFTTDVFEFSARQRLNATTLDSSRSYIERISPYQENIEAEASQTYSRMPTPAGITTTPSPFSAGGMNGAYQPAEFLADVRNGIWSELTAPQVRTNAYRRNLQRAYLDLANNKLNGAAPALPAGLPSSFAALFVTSGDEREFYRAELRALNTAAGAALARTTDRATRVHLEGVRDQIAKILDPRFASSNAAAAAVRLFGFDQLDSFLRDPDTCWPDYIIRP